MNKKLLIIVLLTILVVVSSYYVSNKSTVNPSGKSESTKNPSNTYYPISNYEKRLTFRRFGQTVTTNDMPTCGFPFQGIHNGDDLEAYEYEAKTIVPVYAVSQGKVVFKNYVDGYGGLLVIQTQLDNQDVLLNYGHVNISTAKVALDETVLPGQEIAFLGEGCSSETNGERKHLHFAIHKGTTLDLKGYLQTPEELENWFNPVELLKKLEAEAK